MLIWMNQPNHGSGPFLLLDRDGVINEDRPNYIKVRHEFRFYPDALQALCWLCERQIPVVLISNQSGLNRGIITWENFWDMHMEMVRVIQEAGGDLLGALYCPHRPEEACSCRKPLPGMIQAASRIFGISLSETFFIGDRTSDLTAAAAAGCRGILLDRFGESDRTRPIGAACGPFSNLMEAVRSLFESHTGMNHLGPRANS